MVKRTSQAVRKAILSALKDGKERTFGYLERKVNTNWQTVRNHCKDLKDFGAITLTEDSVKISRQGLEVLGKL